MSVLFGRCKDFQNSLAFASLICAIPSLAQKARIEPGLEPFAQGPRDGDTEPTKWLTYDTFLVYTDQTDLLAVSCGIPEKYGINL